MTGRHRIKGVKREHSVIEGLIPVLERLATHPTVSTIIPGRITVTRAATATLQLRLGPATITGFKLTARRLSTAQEVFVVTTDVTATLAYLRSDVKEFSG